MIPINLNIRQHSLFPLVNVIIEGFCSEDQPILINFMFRIMKSAEEMNAVFIPEKDIPPITKGMKIQISFTAQFKTMHDADSYAKEIANI